MALQGAEALLATADEKKQPLPTVHYTAGSQGDNNDDAKQGAKEEFALPVEAAAAGGGGSVVLAGAMLGADGRASPTTAESKESIEDTGEAFDKAKVMLDLQKRLPDLSFLWTD